MMAISFRSLSTLCMRLSNQDIDYAHLFVCGYLDFLIDEGLKFVGASARFNPVSDSI